MNFRPAPDRLKVPVKRPPLKCGQDCASQKEEPTQVDQQTKAALKHDQFIDTTQHGLEWATEHRHGVIVGSIIAGIVIVAAIVSGVIYSSRSAAAAGLFGQAMAEYQTPLADPSQPVPPGTKTYPTAADRAKAANQIFMQAADKYGLIAQGRLAKYFGGITYMEAGENDLAESTLKEVAGSWDSNLAALAKFALADLYRRTGRDQQAIDLYNELTAKPASTVPAGLAQLQLAELYTAEGKPDQAKRIYAELKDKDAKGPAGMIATQKLNPSAQ